MKPDRLNPRQAMTLTAASILSVDILKVQQEIVKIAHQDAWFSLILGGLLAIAAGMVSYFLASLYPDKDLPEIYIEAAGNFVGRIFLLAVSIYMLLYLGFSLRIFTMALKMFLLDRTPMYALVIFMALTVGYGVFKGIYTIGGIVDTIFPFTIITIAAIIMLSIPQGDFIYLKPVLFDNTEGILKSIIPSFQNLNGYGMILYIYSYSEKTKSSFFWYMTGILIAIAAYVSLTAVSIAVFGPKDVITLIYPTLTLLKAIEFPATFLERLESFAVVLWIGIVYISAVLFYFASTRNLMVLFGIKRKYYKYAVWAQIPVIVFIAMSVESGLMVFHYAHEAKILQAFLWLIITPLVTVVAFIKKKRSKCNEA
jgi:spore germination protein